MLHVVLLFKNKKIKGVAPLIALIYRNPLCSNGFILLVECNKAGMVTGYDFQLMCFSFSVGVFGRDVMSRYITPGCSLFAKVSVYDYIYTMSPAATTDTISATVDETG